MRCFCRIAALSSLALVLLAPVPSRAGFVFVATNLVTNDQTAHPAVLTDEGAAKLERQVAVQNEVRGKPITGERTAPPKGGDGSTGAAGGVGGYNNFWLDAGSAYTIVNGERRTSIVVDPPDGRVPPLTPQARQRAAARLQRV